MKEWKFSKTPVVVVIDDSRSETTIITSLLKKRGVEVHAINEGKYARKTIEQHKPDLILLDVVMPDLNGYEFCKVLAKQPSTKNIPVIFITSLNEPQNVLEGFEAGGSDYISKPFRAEELLARVRAHLELSILHQERLRQTNLLMRSEQRLQRLTLAEGLAHNLNNLLAPLMGNLHWLKDILKNPEAIEVIEEMLEVVERMDRLSAALTGRSQEAMLSTVPLGQLLLDIVQRFELNLRPEFKLVTDFDENDPQDVSHQFETALSAILTNAHEAMENAGEIHLQVSRDTKEGYMVITVSDTGPGLDNETQNKAFMPFFSTKNFVGTGLGLHTAQLVVERMGGTISLKNKDPDDGTGAIATIKIPLDQDAARPTMRLPLKYGSH